MNMKTKEVEVKGVLSFCMAYYPGCCLLAQAFDFSGAKKYNTNDINAITKALEETMSKLDVPSCLIADVEDNSGYRAFISHPKVTLLSVTFNPNSGNWVHLMQYLK